MGEIDPRRLACIPQPNGLYALWDAAAVSFAAHHLDRRAVELAGICVEDDYRLFSACLRRVAMRKGDAAASAWFWELAQAVKPAEVPIGCDAYRTIDVSSRGEREPVDCLFD